MSKVLIITGDAAESLEVMYSLPAAERRRIRGPYCCAHEEEVAFRCARL
jgi:hypothetical protein